MVGKVRARLSPLRLASTLDWPLLPPSPPSLPPSLPSHCEGESSQVDTAREKEECAHESVCVDHDSLHPRSVDPPSVAAAPSIWSAIRRSLLPPPRRGRTSAGAPKIDEHTHTRHTQLTCLSLILLCVTFLPVPPSLSHDGSFGAASARHPGVGGDPTAHHDRRRRRTGGAGEILSVGRTIDGGQCGRVRRESVCIPSTCLARRARAAGGLAGTLA